MADDKKTDDRNKFIDEKIASATEKMTEEEDDRLRESLLKVLKTLTPREEQVIRMHYGIDDNVPHGYDEIAKKYGVTEKRVKEIENRALLKMMHPKNYGSDDGPSK